MKTGNYFATHYWWDEDDNEYVLCATWYYEASYPEMPDSCYLMALEVEEGGELDVSKGGNVWRDVENDGFSLQDSPSGTKNLEPIAKKEILR